MNYLHDYCDECIVNMITEYAHEYTLAELDDIAYDIWESYKQEYEVIYYDDDDELKYHEFIDDDEKNQLVDFVEEYIDEEDENFSEILKSQIVEFFTAYKVFVENMCNFSYSECRSSFFPYSYTTCKIQEFDFMTKSKLNAFLSKKNTKTRKGYAERNGFTDKLKKTNVGLQLYNKRITHNVTCRK